MLAAAWRARALATSGEDGDGSGAHFLALEQRTSAFLPVVSGLQHTKGVRLQKPGVPIRRRLWQGRLLSREQK